MATITSVELDTIGVAATNSLGDVAVPNTVEGSPITLADGIQIPLGNVGPVQCIIVDTLGQFTYDLTDSIPGNATLLACRMKIRLDVAPIVDILGKLRLGAMRRDGRWDAPVNTGFDYAITNEDIVHPTTILDDTIVVDTLEQDQFLGTYLYFAGTAIETDIFIGDASYDPSPSNDFTPSTPDGLKVEVQRVLDDYLSNKVINFVLDPFELPAGVVEEIRLHTGTSDGVTLWLQYSVPDGVGKGKAVVFETVRGRAFVSKRTRCQPVVFEPTVAAHAWVGSRVECRPSLFETVVASRTAVGRTL